MDFPYKRRLQKNSTLESKPKDANGFVKTMGNFVGLTGLISRGLITFFAALAGAVLASFASVYFTLTTLESFKAEESLRQFAIADLYRPLRERSSECLSKRADALAALAGYSGMLKSANGYANEYFLNEKLKGVDFTGAEVLVKPLMDQLTDFAKKAVEGKKIAGDCQLQINNMALELAVVLGVDKEYEDQRKVQINRRPKAILMFGGDDLFVSIFDNPAGTVALILAMKDGMEGEKTRMISSFARIKSLLEKSLRQSEKALTYEKKMQELAYLEDSERTQLFLINLKKRFEVTPRSTLSQTFEEMAAWLRSLRYASESKYEKTL